jgi:hypothetical protein
VEARYVAVTPRPHELAESCEYDSHAFRHRSLSRRRPGPRRVNSPWSSRQDTVTAGRAIVTAIARVVPAIHVYRVSQRDPLYASKKIGERTRTRTSIAGLEDRSLSRWQMRPWRCGRGSNSLMTVLQTAAFSFRHRIELARETGVEPAAFRVRAGRTAACATPEKLVRVAGHDPAASALQTRRSAH